MVGRGGKEKSLLACFAYDGIIGQRLVYAPVRPEQSKRMSAYANYSMLHAGSWEKRKRHTLSPKDTEPEKKKEDKSKKRREKKSFALDGPRMQEPTCHHTTCIALHRATQSKMSSPFSSAGREGLFFFSFSQLLAIFHFPPLYFSFPLVYKVLICHYRGNSEGLPAEDWEKAKKKNRPPHARGVTSHNAAGSLHPNVCKVPVASHRRYYYRVVPHTQMFS